MSDRVARAATRTAIILVLSSRAFAQRVTASVDLSGTNVWYADSIRAAGNSLSPAVRIDWSRATLNASADLSHLSSGGTSLQGTVAPSFVTPSAGMFFGELAGAFGGSTHRDGTRTGQALAMARAYAARPTTGAWIGAGGGRTWDANAWHSVVQREVGGWLQQSSATALATITPVTVEDSVHYTDFQGAVRYPMQRIELGFTAGTRIGAVGSVNGSSSRHWGSVSVVAWMTPRLAIVGDAGSYPVDLTQGYPGGRFVSLALRIASRRIPESAPAAEQRDVLRTTDARARNAGATSFELRTASGHQRVLRVYAPGARLVEINGDFSQWRAVRMLRGSDGWWTFTRTLVPGTYQLNIRIDGGSWLAPQGLLTASDEFGGVVGVLTIE